MGQNGIRKSEHKFCLFLQGCFRSLYMNHSSFLCLPVQSLPQILFLRGIILPLSLILLTFGEFDLEKPISSPPTTKCHCALLFIGIFNNISQRTFKVFIKIVKKKLTHLILFGGFPITF